MKLCESYQARFMFDIDFINEKIICVIIWADKRKVQREKQEKQCSRQKTNNLQQSVKFWLEKRNVIYWDYAVI